MRLNLGVLLLLHEGGVVGGVIEAGGSVLAIRDTSFALFGYPVSNACNTIQEI